MGDSALNLGRACRELIKKAITVGVEAFESKGLPSYETIATWGVPDESGGIRFQSKRIVRRDLWSFWSRCEEQLESSATWTDFEAAFDTLQKSRGVTSEAGWLGGGSIAKRFVSAYLEEAGTLEFLDGVAQPLTSDLIEYGQADTEWAVDLICIEGLSAPGPFELEPTIRVRPITQAELEAFGEGMSSPSDWSRRQMPSEDWWVVETRGSGAKGSPEAWNAVQGTDELIRIGLRAFKSGALSLTAGTVRYEGPFAPGPRGDRRQRSIISRRGGAYSLSEDDLAQLQAFWPPFRQLMEVEDHYLQLSARRLLFGGDRGRLEDSLVDYVIGLEALLSKSDEQTELRYRFSVRGAVVLASDPSERADRFAQLREVYDLRSAVVHGGRPRSDRVIEAVDIAESALRTCWRWYFQNWRAEQDNKRAVAEIDRQLFLIR